MTANTHEQELESQLCILVAKHADWLTGPAWMAVTERIGRAHFDDLPELFDADGFLAALKSELKDG